MNIQEALSELSSNYPGCPIVQLPEKNPTEIICEISRDLHSSTAVAIIDRSAAHKHTYTVETYTILEGQLRLHVDGIEHILDKGDSFVIHPGKTHWAKGGAWVQVECVPAWSTDDHIMI